jgi:hypothetical protein
MSSPGKTTRKNFGSRILPHPLQRSCHRKDGIFLLNDKVAEAKETDGYKMSIQSKCGLDSMDKGKARLVKKCSPKESNSVGGKKEDEH